MSAADRRPPWRIGLRRRLSWLAWRHRYLAAFAVIGFLSICVEVALVLALDAALGQEPLHSVPGFVAGMLFAFWGNYRWNFRVPRHRFWRTLGLFALISTASYSLNLLATAGLHWIEWTNWPVARFVSSGCLFAVAYTLHRRFTFRHAARSLGVAIYAVPDADVDGIHGRLGEHVDHIHLDLVDVTMREGVAEPDLAAVDRIRAAWTWQPIMAHIMSRRPRAWADRLFGRVDAVIVHVDVEDDVTALIAACREHGCQPGVVAHGEVGLARLMPYLPHVDYVLVLGIREPGASGQPLQPAAVATARTLAGLRDRYGFRLIFDGGVTADNVAGLPADLIVSSSSVLRANDPTRAALTLMSGVRNDAGG
ncbi:MAG: hypothetical protein RLZZ127_627 [Planctomycetota bacterium]|jgi:ribulose-phosphate 3-epimerase